MLTTKRNGVTRPQEYDLSNKLIASCDDYIIIAARTKVRVSDFYGILALVLGENWKLAIAKLIKWAQFQCVLRNRHDKYRRLPCAHHLNDSEGSWMRMVIDESYCISIRDFYIVRMGYLNILEWIFIADVLYLEWTPIFLSLHIHPLYLLALRNLQVIGQLHSLYYCTICKCSLSSQAETIYPIRVYKLELNECILRID